MNARIRQKLRNVRRNIINGLFVLIKGASDIGGNSGEYTETGKLKADELIRIANENGQRLMGENAYVLDLLAKNRRGI